MDREKIIKIIKAEGYTTVSEGWYDLVDDWRSWYRGKTAFHSYSVYNGSKKVKCERKTLGMPKKLCEDYADLRINERVQVYAEDQDIIDGALRDNKFWARANQLMEEVAATGTGAFVQYQDNNKIIMDYVGAEHIYPLSWRNREISECAFVSMADDGAYVQFHVLEQGQYVVYNRRYNKKGVAVTLDEGMIPEWRTGSDVPAFQIVKLNIGNNIDSKSPMGISIYHNSIDVIKNIDTIFDSFDNEFSLGKKRIFVDGSVVNVQMQDGIVTPVFDQNDTVFYGLPEMEGSQKIVESNMTLRMEEHVSGLQAALDVLSDNVGFGRGYYKFEEGTVSTATEVISQNSKLYRKVQKDNLLLEDAIVGMVRSILQIAGKNADQEITVSFDDSIIEDTQAIAARSMMEFNAGIIDRIEYFKRVYNMTDEAAQELDAEIASRAPEPQATMDWF